MRLKEILIVTLLSTIWLSVYSREDKSSPSRDEVISYKTDSKIQSLVVNGNLPSIQILVISDNRVSYSKSYGEEAGEKVLYKIGSIEKVITATALLLLHEKGIIDINNDVNDYLPFTVRHPKYSDIPVTVIMLMAHRSGLDMFQYQFEWDTKDINYNNDSLNHLPNIVNLTKDEYIRASLDSLGENFDPNVWKFKPGTNYHYSNTGYFILNSLIEYVTDKSYSEYVSENIFHQLGLNHSVFSDIDSTANFSNSYTRKGSENIKLPFLNGMYTNVYDMAILMLTNLNHGQYNGISLLKPETIDLMHKRHSYGKNIFHPYRNCPYKGYGLGIIQYNNYLYGHGGSTIGYQSLWSFNKSDKSGYIILTNINGLLHGKENFDSVWKTVSSVEKLLKAELKYSFGKLNLYLIIGIAGLGIVINVLYFRRKLKNRKL